MNHLSQTSNIHFSLKMAFQTIVLSLLFMFISINLKAQSFYSSPIYLEKGFSVRIYSVTQTEGVDTAEDTDDDTYEIVLEVSHNGRSEGGWNGLNHFSVEAEPGTYSEMGFTNIYGDVSSNGINKGPKLGGWNKDGFRISSINNIGPGKPRVFLVSYTLSGSLQNQYVMAKAGKEKLEHQFMVADFESVKDSEIGGVYPILVNGKLEDPNNKIGPELTALANFNFPPLMSKDIFEVVEKNNISYVVAEFIPSEGYTTTDLINVLKTTYGLIEVIEDVENNIIAGQIPIDRLLDLNSEPSLASARPIYPVGTNSIISQGDISMKSNFARQVFTAPDGNGGRRAIDGQGFKIGVISNSYDTKEEAVNDIGNRELPEGVHLLKEYPYGTASDEGRAMLQIVHDVAPGAQLAFRTGVLGASDMALGIEELKAAGCNIIVDDITYITQPFFEDGILAQKVDQVVDDGISYFTSAGNFGAKSYTETFSPGSKISGIIGSPHDFGNGDYYQAVTVGNSIDENKGINEEHYTIVLQWEEIGSSFSNTNTDLDIYLMNEDGSGRVGYNRINTGGYAIEVLPFVVKKETTTNIVIVNASGSNSVTFKYVVFKGSIEINDNQGNNSSSTIVGHANAAGAMTVGAIRYDKTPAYQEHSLRESIPEELPTDILNIMSYSSVGGQLVGGVNRYKPDFTAPNGVNTTVNLSGKGTGDWAPSTDDLEGDTDTDPNFFGTSAAAPHAAAVAALLMDAKNAYYGEIMLSNEIRTVLLNSAIGSASHSLIYGHGFIQADAALLEMANSAPLLSKDIIVEKVDDTGIGTPGAEEVKVTINGNYLTNDATIYFNGLALPTTSDGTSLEAIIQPYSGLSYPQITAYNPPKDGTLGFDGGMSEAIYFEYKPIIRGTLELSRYSKSYGEEMPSASLKFEVIEKDGNGTKTTELSAYADLDNNQKIRINQISNLLSTNADAMSDVGSWSYFLPDNILNPSSDADILDYFDLDFILGSLNITKLDITIAPKDITIEYGDPIGEMFYNYTYDQTYTNSTNSQIKNVLDIALKENVLTELTVMANGAFYTDNSTLTSNSFYITKSAYANAQALALVNAKALALVNLYPEKTEAQLSADALALVNAKALALVNAKALALVNAKALALVNENQDYLENANALALVNANALALVNANALALVNAQSLQNAAALALVNDGDILNANALALVNTTSDAFNSPDYVANANALALVNDQSVDLVNADALALVNARALALVNARALALVNLFGGVKINTLDDDDIALVNAHALALVNAQALALVNLYPGQEMSELNAAALALVNAKALALVNAQALALVNADDADALLSAQALALVNIYGEGHTINIYSLDAAALALVNAKALALVNAKALALVNNSDLSGSELNAAALALVNTQEFAFANAQALALVNVYPNMTLNDLIVNAKALALVNAKALALVNAAALALVNADALALVNGLTVETFVENAAALALVNAKALALVNADALALVNADALALVNAAALALVNARALALVNLYPGVDISSLNAEALALVNAEALALVNAASFNAVSSFNENAVIILTVADIRAMQTNNKLEVLAINIISGNTVSESPHKIAPGVFMAKNFNIDYEMGDLTVTPSEINFPLLTKNPIYDGNTHELDILPSYKERLDMNGDPYIIIPETKPFTETYLKDGASITGLPINEGNYKVAIESTDQNYSIGTLPDASLIIHPVLAYVPDDNFEQALKALGYDDVLDDYVFTHNINSVESLSIIDKGITDLTGIEHFSSLVFLELSGSSNFDFSPNQNQITSIDLSNNTKLEHLDLGKNKLTSLDLTNNPNLTYLEVWLNELTSLDLTHNPKLEMLSAGFNQLSEIDVSQNPNLINLQVFRNQITNIDLSQNSMLEYVYVHNGYDSSIDYPYNNTLTSLDISNNPNIKVLYISETDITSINLSNNPNLEVLRCRNSQLTSLDVSNNFALITLDCADNPLNNLDVSNNRNLKYLYCRDNQLTSLNVSNNTLLESLQFHNNQLTNLDISQNTALKALTCDDNYLTSLDVTHAESLWHLSFERNQLTSIDISSNTLLTSFYCNGNQLTNIDLSKHLLLTLLWCHDNELITLNLANNNNLKLTNFNASNNQYLTCIQVDDAAWSTANWANIDPQTSFSEDCNASDLTYVPDDNFEQLLIDRDLDDVLDDYVLTSNINTIMTIDLGYKNISDLTGIEAFVELTALYCYANQLTNLDLSDHVNLETLICHDNQLTNLNLSNCTALALIVCNGNPLTNLDLSNNTSLNQLYCYNTQLTNLDLSDNISLTMLECHSNHLTSINLPNSTNLEFVNLWNNQLINLDVSNNSGLITLICVDNQLTSLDVSKNNVLESLYCGGNQLNILDVSSNPALTVINCSLNQLTSLDVSNNTALTNLNCTFNQLTSLNVKNGNNINFYEFNTLSNPDLTCIQVDDAVWSAANWTYIDYGASFSNFCSSSSTSTFEILEGIGLSSESLSGKIELYPNPVTDKLTVSLGELADIKEVSLYTMFGKLTVVSQNWVSDHRVELNLSGLLPGIYMVKVRLNDTIKVFRIIKK